MTSKVRGGERERGTRVRRNCARCQREAETYVWADWCDRCCAEIRRSRGSRRRTSVVVGEIRAKGPGRETTVAKPLAQGLTLDFETGKWTP